MMEMETCRFYSQVSQTVQGLLGGGARGALCCCACVLLCMCVVDPLLLTEQCVSKSFLNCYLTVWTVVRRPFWPICPGRKGLSGGGSASQAGSSLAHSSHSPLKRRRPAGEKQAGWVLQEVGPPPWALPLFSPSGTGHLCCSLRKMIEPDDNYRLDSDQRDLAIIQYQVKCIFLFTE